jgi:hypothetical protein
MINFLNNSHTVKNWLPLKLFFVLLILIPNLLPAQSKDNIDSLITVKKEFTKNEKIEFTVRLEKQAKRNPQNVRLVPTMSCNCGKKDFYYELYSVNKFKYPSKRNAFLIHSEKPDANRCSCKSSNAEFYDKINYFIPSINKNGKYILIIRGNGFTMYSNIFRVTD